MLEIEVIEGLIITLLGTIAWYVQRRLTQSLSWPLMQALTWVSSLLTIYVGYFIAHIMPETWIYGLVTFLLGTLILLSITWLLFIKTNNKLMLFLKQFLPVAIPLTTFIFLILFASIEWTVNVNDVDYGLSNKHECYGFPLPCYGSFYQLAGSGDYELSIPNFVIDLVSYFLLAYLFFYVGNKVINFSKLFPKIVLILFCAFFYLVSLHLFLPFVDTRFHWPDKVQLQRLNFHWLGL